MKDERVKSIANRARSLRDMRKEGQWESLWEELSHYFLPKRRGFVTERTEGTPLDTDLWISFPQYAARDLVSMAVASVAPKGRRWIGMSTSIEALMQEDEVASWLQVVSYIMAVVLYDPRVRFMERLKELIADAFVLGTGVIYVDHDRKEKRLTMRVKHLKDVVFEESATGNLDKVYCFWSMKLGQLVEQFGLGALPDALRRRWADPKTDQSKCYEVIHAVVPNEEFVRHGFGRSNFPFASLWILSDESHQLDRGGFYDQPYIVVRCDVVSQEMYGRGVAESALPDARLANSVASALLEITEKQGNPPVQAPLDILRGDVEMFPGGITLYDSSGFQFQGEPIRPVQLGANPALTHEYLQHLRGEVNQAFMQHVASAAREGKLGKEQMQTMRDQFADQALPLMTSIEDELLPPILDRVFSILVRTRSLPPAPQKITGMRLDYKFDNRVADMRDLSEAHDIIQSLMALLQMQRPELVENIDWDATFRDLLRKMKFKESYLLPLKDVLAGRKQQAQMQQAQQLAEIAKAAGPGMKGMADAAATTQEAGLAPGAM